MSFDRDRKYEKISGRLGAESPPSAATSRKADSVYLKIFNVRCRTAQARRLPLSPRSSGRSQVREEVRLFYEVEQQAGWGQTIRSGSASTPALRRRLFSRRIVLRGCAVRRAFRRLTRVRSSVPLRTCIWGAIRRGIARRPIGGFTLAAGFVVRRGAGLMCRR